jgi:hypothetical protein
MYAVMAFLLWGGAEKILILVFALPFIQLGVCLLTALIIAVVPCLEPREVYLRSIGRITLGTIAGTLIGVGVMVLFPVLLALIASVAK